MTERKRWRVIYLPSSSYSREVEWVYYGNESDLAQYLQERHSCSCADCQGKDWWDTAQSAEYIIEEVVDDAY